MDGRNAGGSNTASSGRPKLVRSGLSSASETRPNSQEEDNLSKAAFLENIPLPPTEAPSSGVMKTNTGNKIAKGSTQKPSEAGISSTQSSVPTSAKTPVAIVPSGMSEGLSLVSYSSSSSENSASEDNDQDDLIASSASEDHAASKKSGVLGDQETQSLMQKMEEIADSQEKSNVSSNDDNEISLPSDDKQTLPIQEESNTTSESEAKESEAKRTDIETAESLVETQAEEKVEVETQKSQVVDEMCENQEMPSDGESLATQEGQLGGIDTVSAIQDSELGADKEKAASVSLNIEASVSDDNSFALEKSYSLNQGEAQVSASSHSQGAEHLPSKLEGEPITSASSQDQSDLPSDVKLVETHPQLPLNTEGASEEAVQDKLGVESSEMGDDCGIPSAENIDEALQSAAKEFEGMEEKDVAMDPIEEQLKLLTEGPPVSTSCISNLTGEESVLKSEPENPSFVSAESNPLDSTEEGKPEEMEVLPTPEVEKKSEVPITTDLTDNICGETIQDREEKIEDIKRKPEQHVCETESPMEVESTDVAVTKMPAVDSNTSSEMNNSSAIKENEAVGTPADISTESKSEVKHDPKGNKRTYDEGEPLENVEHVPEEPKEKRMRLEETDDASLASKNGSVDDPVNVQEEKSEMMETDSETLKKGIPTFEKLSEELKATGRLSKKEEGTQENNSCMEEESKTEMDDSCMDNSLLKDSSDMKDKDDDKEVATPSSKKKRKKKSYERPRGEGGKFRKERPDPSLLDEETRMEGTLPQDEDSQGSVSKREVRRFRCEVIVPESTEVFTADKVVEYVWPLEGCGEHYFIQEQISQYLGIMSFKRKYPDLRRRPLEMQERDYLKDKGLVSEMACDLGLTAVRSEDVLDVMLTDFPSKFEELQRLLRERKENEIKERGKVSYSMATLDKSKMQEYLKKAAEDSARWNAIFNKEKREERRYNFDLQTFTLQMCKGRHKVLPSEMTKIGAYPVAVLPGQFTDYYRAYAPAELKSMPLNTVMCGPMNNDQLGSDGAGSDSEEETSALPSTDTTDSTEIKEEKTEGLPRCKVCSGTKNRNKGGKPEPLIICAKCRSASHPTCIDLTLVMVPKIESYNWQCMDCKSCVTCSDPDDEDKMIFCDMCDRGYHIYCVGLRRVPNGRWHCKECAICSSCGSKTPAGIENCKNAEWQHEFKKDKNNKQLRYATTLCVPCDKYWKRRQFCYVCLKVYRSIPEDGMVRCSNCPKYIHREGCSTMYENERFCNNCFKIRNSTALNHSRIIAAAKKKMASGY